MWLNFFLEISKIYKKRLIFLFFIMIFSVIFDVISIGSIFPLLGFIVTENYDYLKEARGKWVDRAIKTDNSGKETKWTQNIAA